MQLCHFPLQLFGLNFNLDLLLQFKDEYVVNDHSQWVHQFHFNTRLGQMVLVFLLNKGLLLAIQRDQTVQCHLQIDQSICQNHSIPRAPRIHMVAGFQHKENWSELHALQGLVICYIRDGVNKLHVGAQCSLQRKNSKWISTQILFNIILNRKLAKIQRRSIIQMQLLCKDFNKNKLSIWDHFLNVHWMAL